MVRCAIASSNGPLQLIPLPLIVPASQLSVKPVRNKQIQCSMCVLIHSWFSGCVFSLLDMWHWTKHVQQLNISVVLHDRLQSACGITGKVNSKVKVYSCNVELLPSQCKQQKRPETPLHISCLMFISALSIYRSISSQSRSFPDFTAARSWYSELSAACR